MKALVTGGAGYVGSHVVRALLDAGHEMVVVDDLSTGHEDAVDARAEFVSGCKMNDVRDSVQMRAVLRMEKPHVVIHLAGKVRVDESASSPNAYWDVNVGGTLSLLDALVHHSVDERREMPGLVFSSSAAVYGVPAFERGRFPKLTEDHPTNPTNVYGDTKHAAERAIGGYARAFGLPAIALRYFNAAGANVAAGLRERHDPETHLIPTLLEVARGRRASFTLHGGDYPTVDGSAVRDFVHVEDLARAHVLAADKLVAARERASQIYNLGRGEGHSVLEVVRVVEEVTGETITTSRTPRREGDPPYLVADASRAAELLGWRADKDLRTIVSDAWALCRD